MNILAPAKINLYLNITGVRENGYHEIETLFQTVSLYDSLDVRALKNPGKPSVRLTMEQDASLSAHSGGQCPPDSQNIVWKAAELFFRARGKAGNCSIRLRKNLPIQAGLGGGSSDAAAILKALSRLYPGLPGGSEKLSRIALKLGADVPFFLKGGCAQASGIGEKITPLRPYPRFWAVVVKPPLGLSTKEVYGWYDRDRKPSKNGAGRGLTSKSNLPIMRSLILGRKPAGDWCPYIFNCFEDVVFKRVPELKKVKERLLDGGALNACMSGSGSAFFGIAGSRKKGEELKRKINRFYGQVWVVRSI